MFFPPPETPPALGSALFHAELKSVNSDFCVEEVLGFDPKTGGEHLYLELEKCGMNTDELSPLDDDALRQLLFSLSLDASQPVGIDGAGSVDSGYEKKVRILRSSRHSKKLRRGAHEGNRFTIILRNIVWLDDLDIHQGRARVIERFKFIQENGFPNYIGPQRFGHGGRNFIRAQQWFNHPKKRTSRQQRSLWLSASRSALFNSVCAERVRTNSWHRLLAGEPAVLDGSKSFFTADETSSEELNRRLKDFDIHPSGPWWGRGPNPSGTECAALENSVLSHYGTICTGLEKAGLKQERRALRANAVGLTHEWLDESTIKIEFLLPPGVFATTLVSELCSCLEPERR